MPTREIMVAVGVGAVVLAGCGSDATNSSPQGSGEPGFEIELLVDDLVGPTQLFVDDEGWLIAQLNGGEEAGQGQVLAIDRGALDGPIDPERRKVAIDGLDKPTGVARVDGAIWVMEAETLRRIGTSDDIMAGPLASNGRSQGTLTVVDDALLFNTSGRIDGDVVDPESGRIWSVSLADAAAGELALEEYARGFKHAYDRVELDDGTLLTTEIGDGRLDGEPAADAVIVVEQGADHGWPGCVPQVQASADGVGRNGADLRRVVEEFEGSCTDLPRIVAAFPVGATPTSVETVPWDSSLVAVALWGTGEVVLIDFESGETVASIDFDRPQDLVVDGDRLLVVDHERGAIYGLTT